MKSDKLAGNEFTEDDLERETNVHIERVRNFISIIIDDLKKRAIEHDESKLKDPERKGFLEYTPKLKGSTYGSDEYKGFLKDLQSTLKHHYKENRHHPEHFENGIKGMNLVDLIEALSDWRSATERHEDGDIRKSIIINKERFGYSEDLCQILFNTIDYFNW